MGLSDFAARKTWRREASSPADEQRGWTKDIVFREVGWIHTSLARRHDISYPEILDHWLTLPAAVAAAADWRVATDNEQPYPLKAQQSYLRFAAHAHAQGWSVFPETRIGKRRPAILQMSGARGRSIPLYVKPKDRRDALQSLSELISEIELAQHGSYNVGIVISRSSGNIRALDIDCSDPELAAAIIEAANRIFGVTPFIRVGRAPRALLIYRMAGERDLALRTRSLDFLGADGKPDLVVDDEGATKARNSIEFLSDGHNFTAYGLHHLTGQSFDWSNGALHPAIAGPEHAPIITGEQLKAFFRAVHRIRRLDQYSPRSASSSPIGGDSEVSTFRKSPVTRWTKHAVWVPERARGAWQTDKEGYVVDGREKYLHTMIWAFMSANVDLLRTRSGAEQLFEECEVHCKSRIFEDRKWPRSKVITEHRTKWRSALDKWQASIAQYDRTKRWLEPAIPRRVLDDGSSTVAQHVQGAARPVDGAMDWLPEQPSFLPELSGIDKIKGLLPSPLKTAEQTAADRAARALVENPDQRHQIHLDIAARIDAAGAEFVAAIEAHSPDQMAPLHILRAPTGSGKTTRIVAKALGAWCKAHPRGADDGPILVLMPTHANIDEAMLSAERAGMTVPEPTFDESEAVERLAANGVKATVFMGKARAGCQRSTEMKALTEAGIGASGLCGATIEEDGDEVAARLKRRAGERPDREEILCEFRVRGECAYYRQFEELKTADIVFLPHSYLTMSSMPKALKKARAVIVDESIVYLMLHFTLMPVSILRMQRAEPSITKKEREAQPDRKPEQLAIDLLDMRMSVAEIVEKAMLARKDPAAAIIEAKLEDCVEAAIKVVRRAHQSEREINPRMSLEQIQKLAVKPKGRHLLDEARLWSLIQDRIELLAAGKAKGDVDKRLFLVSVGTDEVPHIRMSWRSKQNWDGVPMMLLDASSSPKITMKCFGRDASEIVVHDIEAPARVRTIAMIERPWSNRSFIPPGDAEDDEIAAAEQTVKKSRLLISKMGGAFAHGRVLVGAAKGVRERLLMGGWAPPKNVDAVHFGALRGLDFAKHHSAALSIGRSEQPIYVLDSYTAALTYDDDEPESPFDALGTGMTAAGKPLFREGQPRKIPMRTGQDVYRLVPTMPTPWGRELEAQWREEELRQFLGRLRPVYRDGAAPVWVCMSSALPEDVVVDELFTLDDMTRDAEFYDVLRVGDGVLVNDERHPHPLIAAAIGDGTVQKLADKVIEQRPEHIERIFGVLGKVRYRGVDKRIRTARVAAWHDDAATAVIDHFRRTGAVVEIIDVEPPAIPRDVTAMARKPDRIDSALDDMADGYGGVREYQRSVEKYLWDALTEIQASGRAEVTMAQVERRFLNGLDPREMIYKRFYDPTVDGPLEPETA